jgi:hypothetical protein
MNPNFDEAMDEKFEAPAVQQNAMVEVESTRAIQEVQAQFVIAKKYPRDSNAAHTRIIDACKRLSLAKQAMYAYPRAGQTITGPSIRMAEVLAQNWGNLNFGIRELERKNGKSIAESFCHDLETNVRQSKVFEVDHQISTKKGMKKLTDPRDVYELVANNGARRLRACILGVIPGDIVESAVIQCKATVAKGGGQPMSDRIREMLIAFKEFGVSQEMIEARLGHKIDLTTGEEIAEMSGVYAAIRDKQAKRGDFFEFPEDEVSDGRAAELSERLKEKQ